MTLRFHRRTLFGLVSGLMLASTSLSPAFAQDAASPTYAMVQINQQALFFNQMIDGAQKAADAAGAKLVVFNANDDPARQNDAIETYIQQGVDGLIVVAIDVNGIMPAVEAADKAGIPVVAVDAILPEGPQKAQIGVDNAEAGKMIGEYMKTYVGENMDGKAVLGIVGALNSFIQNVRQEGFENVLKGDDNIETVGVVDGRNIQDEALSAAENLITANPNLNAIYATGEPALVGAIAAVESQGKQDSVKIFGWDLTAQAIDGIDAGFVTAVVQQDPAAMGAAAVEALETIRTGGTVEASISVPIEIVTKENVDPYRETYN